MRSDVTGLAFRVTVGAQNCSSSVPVSLQVKFHISVFHSDSFCFYYTVSNNRYITRTDIHNAFERLFVTMSLDNFRAGLPIDLTLSFRLNCWHGDTRVFHLPSQTLNNSTPQVWPFVRGTAEQLIRWKMSHSSNACVVNVPIQYTRIIPCLLILRLVL